jgi:hypothetical protein
MNQTIKHGGLSLKNANIIVDSSIQNGDIPLGYKGV